MKAPDWFRKKTWTSADQEDFFARLKWSRGVFNKAQYLRIQAYELQCVGTEEMFKTSLQLLKLLLTEYDEGSQAAQAYNQQGGCLKGLQRIDEALISYRKTMEIERRDGKWATGAYLSFARLVATMPIPRFYDEALAALNEFGKREFLPVQLYWSSASRALIYKARENLDLAKSYAQAALEAASEDHSGLRYHSKLGLVKNPDEKIFDQLKQLSV
jgi:tetratricopeptide (TPR) repeat protein